MPLRKLCRPLAAALLATGLSACAPVAVLNALVPVDKVEIQRDFEYGKNKRQKLDVYRTFEGDPVRPIVVFFYGGSWDSGEKSSYLFVAEALASRGFVAVVPDYRVYPEVTFPGFIEDAAASVAWVKANAAMIGGDPNRIFVMGHSAGAHVAAMVAYDGRYLDAAGMKASELRGMIGLAGPYDFLPLKSETLKKIFAPEETIARTQPVNFVTRGAPPALLITGESDTTVYPKNSDSLAAKLQANGVAVTRVRYPELGHVSIVAKLATPLRGKEPLLDDIEKFVRGR